MEKFFNYCIAQLDKMTAWIGLIGIICLMLGMHTALAIIFVLLIVLPEAEFSELFKRWTKGIREIEKDLTK